jgi:hypothetical protein
MYVEPVECSGVFSVCGHVSIELVPVVAEEFVKTTPDEGEETGLRNVRHTSLFMTDDLAQAWSNVTSHPRNVGSEII